MRDETNIETLVNKPVASAGDADPGQGGFWEDPRQAEVQHAFAHATDGRADSTCCAQTAALELVCTAWLRRKAVTAC